MDNRARNSGAKDWAHRQLPLTQRHDDDLYTVRIEYNRVKPMSTSELVQPTRRLSLVESAVHLASRDHTLLGSQPVGCSSRANH